MKYVHKLESHKDIGYSNFFDQIREEYNDHYDFMNDDKRLEFINNKLKQYNCHAVISGDNYGEAIITFDDEMFFTAFLLKYG